jgi:hypothetical protein
MTHDIIASDFREFKVCDGIEDTCSSCAPHNPTRPAAPVIIAGKPYCLWCALEVAVKLLGGRRVS